MSSNWRVAVDLRDIGWPIAYNRVPLSSAEAIAAINDLDFDVFGENAMRLLTLFSMGCLLLAASVATSAGEEPKVKDGSDGNDISMEIQAIRTLRTFKFTDDQLKLLMKLSKMTAEADRKRTPAKISDEARQKLKDLHVALVDDTDDDKIDNLEDEWNQIMDKEKPELDDSFDITKGARQHTREVLKGLTVNQLAEYYGDVKEDVNDPRERLPMLLQEVRELSKTEWRDQRDGFADEIAWAAAGVDVPDAEKVSDKIVALLSKARSMSKEEFTMKRESLDKEALELIGDIGPDDVLRHHAQHAIAELLSNPRLEAAIKRKLK